MRLLYESKIAPQAAEPTEPVPVENTIGEKDSHAAAQRSQGSIVPISSIRPTAPKAVKEDGNVVVARELAGNLGTSPEIRQTMRIDERKFAVLDDVTLAALSHFSYRYVNDGVRYWGHIVEWWLTGSQGIGGLARRHVLQAIANSSGAQQMDKAKKPNALARNLWDRDWKDKAEAQGKVVED